MSNVSRDQLIAAISSGDLSKLKHIELLSKTSGVVVKLDDLYFTHDGNAVIEISQTDYENLTSQGKLLTIEANDFDGVENILSI